MRSQLVTKLFAGFVAGSISLAAIIFAYIALVPIDVLQNWKITVPNAEYKIGDTIEATSEFVKVRSALGTARRYIECQNPAGKYSNRYEAPEGVADRAPGTGATTLVLKVPADVVNPPVTCRIAITVEYEIYSLRKHAEHVTSNEFRVLQSDQPISDSGRSDESDNIVVENAPVTGNAKVENGRVDPQPVAPLPPSNPDNERPEDSPVIPPNNSLVCRVPVVTWLIVNPLIGVC